MKCRCYKETGGSWLFQPAPVPFPCVSVGASVGGEGTFSCVCVRACVSLSMCVRIPAVFSVSVLSAGAHSQGII